MGSALVRGNCAQGRAVGAALVTYPSVHSWHLLLGIKTGSALVTECQAETVSGRRGGCRALQVGAVFCSVLCSAGDKCSGLISINLKKLFFFYFFFVEIGLNQGWSCPPPHSSSWSHPFSPFAVTIWSV